MVVASQVATCGALAPLGAVVVAGELVDDDSSGHPNRVDTIGVLTNKSRWQLVKLETWEADWGHTPDFR